LWGDQEKIMEAAAPFVNLWGIFACKGFENQEWRVNARGGSETVAEERESTVKKLATF